MSNAFIALMMAAGAGGWVFRMFSRRTGNNNQQSVSAAAIAGILVFMITMTILSFAT